MRGATGMIWDSWDSSNISIHAPRAGRDNIHLVDLWAQEIFQSTRPVRGATADIPVDILPRLISIHAPRAGRDSKFMLLCR